MVKYGVKGATLQVFFSLKFLPRLLMEIPRLLYKILPASAKKLLMKSWGKMYFHIVTSAFYLPRQKVLKFEGCTIFSENAKAHQIWIDENLVYLIKPYLSHILLIFFLILFIVILFRWGTHLCMSLFPSVRPSVVHHISGTVHQMTITVSCVTCHI